MVSARQAVCTHQQLQDKQSHRNIPVSLDGLKHSPKAHPRLHRQAGSLATDQTWWKGPRGCRSGLPLLAVPVASLLYKWGMKASGFLVETSAPAWHSFKSWPLGWGVKCGGLGVGPSPVSLSLRRPVSQVLVVLGHLVGKKETQRLSGSPESPQL